MKVLIFGLSITSSWGNGHTVTLRALTKALRKRGHEVIFFEWDVPWYLSFRDKIPPEHGRLQLYSSLAELARFEDDLKEADCVIIGSFVPEGVPLSNQSYAIRATPLRFFMT
jgi:spore maturation protein CgeB